MRPILRGIVPYKALDSHDYTIEDFVFINEALDVEAENQRRAHEHMRQQNTKEKR